MNEERNCLEVLNSESRTEIDTIPRKQALIQKNEVCFVRANEFQGRQTIRSEDDLIACLLCKHLTKL
jgi:hypothetical protein